MQHFKLPWFLPALVTGFFFSILFHGCRPRDSGLLSNGLDSIGSAFVTDGREGIYDVKLYSKGKELILKGETDNPDARRSALDYLERNGIHFTDSLLLLPDTVAIKDHWGLVNVSVCNIRLIPSYSAELTSQALMGTPVMLLKKENGWLMLQTPDRYIGWVDSDAIAVLTLDDYLDWKSSERIFYKGKTGDIFGDAEKKKIISDVVAGCILRTIGIRGKDYRVILPDGRTGFIPVAHAMNLDDLDPDKLLTPENLISCAESFTGIPYLWGGTSVKGFDCSGFVKTVYYLSGIILARDASLQFRHGTETDTVNIPGSLNPGDLLFFGSVREGKPRATHVAMYTGDTEYIHASGMVRINSFDSARTNFSRYRRDTFIGVRRIIGTPYGEGIRPVTGHPWYK